MKIAVYGTGKVAQSFYNIIKKKGIKIVYFVQTKKTAEYFCGYKVISADEIDYSEIDYLVIASNIYYQEMISHLKNLNNGYELNRHKVVKARDCIPKIWESFQNYMPYISCKVDKDIIYIVE